MIYHNFRDDVAFTDRDIAMQYFDLQQAGATKKELREFREANAQFIDPDFE